ncbi:hypothetical protein XA68_16734 [Ophiocordyceps unilateralis]|uniref:Mitochondrial thiamine pyrophosphate carrier 1 n=1 Tax=Ophiocordyceps unilateralis TaxID=268505 RepID=A0A2A9PJH2_OPHUN|nr:hypothetical protein XA68_16734 [Ophiocordyceps unilateralis]
MDLARATRQASVSDTADYSLRDPWRSCCQWAAAAGRCWSLLVAAATSLVLACLVRSTANLPSRYSSSSYSSSSSSSSSASTTTTLPPVGHGLAGVLAGATVSFIAAPVEHIKARLQVQYAATKANRFYAGPLDCARRIYAHHGVRGIYHGLAATMLFRSFFFVWWSGYDVLMRSIRRLRPQMPAPAVQFCAAGLSAQLFWLTSYPADVVKQRIMTDPLGGSLRDGNPTFPRWRDAAVAVWREAGWRGYWRGFLPCFLRAFPANASALVVFEAVMRTLP